MRTGNESGYVEKLYRDRAATVDTRTVVRLAFIRYTEALTGACYLEITDGALRVDCGETRK